LTTASFASWLSNNFWTVAERLSWLVAIVGLPFGVYQVFALRREQSRVAQELARRPELIVGFYPFNDGKTALSLRQDLMATWQPGNPWSDPVEFTIVCHNAGRRSAHNVLYNFKFPLEFDYLTQIPVRQGRMVKSPDDGRSLWVISDEHIHPDDSATFSTAIKIPAKLAAIPIDAEISMEDWPAVRVQLSLRIIVHPPALKP